MKVGIMGPGAMGCLFAARLARAGNKVHLIDHRSDRAERLQRRGVTITGNGQSFTERVSVSTQAPTGLDLLIVLTKAYHTSSLRFPPETPVLTLQNGLGNVETLCSAVGSARVIAGATSEAATLVEEGVVRHAGSGLTRLGGWTSCNPEPAMNMLVQAGFECAITQAPGQMIWEKVSINSGINPLTAILNVANGQLLQLPETRPLMRDLVVEAAKVASTEGYRFAYSLVELAEETCRKTGENISSMLQDVRAGKQTEIEAISGEILRRAQLASLPTPRTRVVYQLVRGLESR
ncbi:MAG: 2-dehydropantoate 2-reductase [Candidatus Hydrogenedentes bacterium]|nr:2-dehydropantoate 2-reductase [Candidatus Hydrogenedentota bacterium]